MKLKMAKGKPWALVPPAVVQKFQKWTKGAKAKLAAKKLVKVIKKEFKNKGKETEDGK